MRMNEWVTAGDEEGCTCVTSNRSQGPAVLARSTIQYPRRRWRPRRPRASVQVRAAVRRHDVGSCCAVPERHRRARVRPRTAAAVHRHRADRREHRPWAQGRLGGARLAALRARAAVVRPQPRGGNPARSAHTLAIPARRGPVVVLRHCPDGVVAGALENAATAVVGSDYQQRLHVIFHRALRGRRCALAAQPKRLGGLRPAVRRAVIRRARRLRRPAGSALGGRTMHPRRRCRWPVRPALHVPKPCGSSRRRTARGDAHQSARRSPVHRADIHSRLGNDESAVGRSAGQLRTGQRESGRGGSLTARRADRNDLDFSVAAGQARLAPTAGGVPAGDGVRAGVLRRALRLRHPVGLGAGCDGDRGVRPVRHAALSPPCVDVSAVRPG
jgi:hypothetical protein